MMFYRTLGKLKMFKVGNCFSFDNDFQLHDTIDAHDLALRNRRGIVYFRSRLLRPYFFFQNGRVIVSGNLIHEHIRRILSFFQIILLNCCSCLFYFSYLSICLLQFFLGCFHNFLLCLTLYILQRIINMIVFYRR